MPEVTLGWPPNYGMGIVLSLMGRAAAMELALTGRRLNARDAASLGLVNELVPHTQLSGMVTQRPLASGVGHLEIARCTDLMLLLLL